MIDGIIMKGRHIVMPEVLKPQVLDQLNINHMGIEKTKLLACKSIYWPNINKGIESVIKLHYMSYISADTAKGQHNPSQHPK